MDGSMGISFVIEWYRYREAVCHGPGARLIQTQTFAAKGWSGEYGGSHP